MVKRIISSLVGLPILIALVAIGGIPLKVSVLIVSIIGMFEIYKVLSKRILPVHYITYFFAVFYILFIEHFDFASLQIFYALLISITLASLVFFHKKYNVKDCAIALFGFSYVTVLLSNILLVREFGNGKFVSYHEIFVWLIFISAWGCDTGAYFAGKAFGKHKLAPVLSPNKTIEGSIGGVITAALLGAIFAFAISSSLYEVDQFFNIHVVILFSVICAIGSIFSQLGDLTASAIKRYTKTKDYGNIIPGHGGVIDRFDSILFTAPCIYIMLWIF